MSFHINGLTDQPVAETTAIRKRGALKVFLGFAAGVGKTFAMLEEAQRLRASGVDVVVGYFEPHARKDTIAQTEGLESVPRQTIEYRGTSFPEMNTPAILARHPQVCLVDEFAHTNVPGAPRAKRWEDVVILLDAGIDVLTTVNIQHLESLNDQVFQITGVRVRETIPDWLLEQASEVVMIDLTPRALLNRLERGVVYAPDKAAHALQNFFRESTLVALREMALRQTAHEVETRIAGAPPRERLVVLVTADPGCVALIRRAKRVAGFIHADCVAVAIIATHNQSGAARAQIDQHLNFARNLHLDTRLITANEISSALVQFARTHGGTQILLNWPREPGWRPAFIPNDVQKIVRLAYDMQVTIVDRKT